jgi:hypothetical protein
MLERHLRRKFSAFGKWSRLRHTSRLMDTTEWWGKDGPGGGSRTHTGSDPRQILSLLRLPVPPLRENLIENSMEECLGKAAERDEGVFRSALANGTTLRSE